MEGAERRYMDIYMMTHLQQPASSSSSLPGFGSGSRTSTPGPSGSGSTLSSAATSSGTGTLPPPQLTPTFHVGLWRVQPATHKVTQKRVSVWTFDKRELDRVSGAGGKDRIIEALKNEVRLLVRWQFH